MDTVDHPNRKVMACFMYTFLRLLKSIHVQFDQEIYKATRPIYIYYTA